MFLRDLVNTQYGIFSHAEDAVLTASEHPVMPVNNHLTEILHA